MFDIGFWELAVIMIVGLVVIGPDKLPGIARSAGKWVGKARYFIASVKQDVSKELRAEELKQALARDAGLDEIKQIMNTDQFTLEEDDEPGYVVRSIDDDQKHTQKNETDTTVTKASIEEVDTSTVSATDTTDTNETSVNKNNT